MGSNKGLDLSKTFNGKLWVALCCFSIAFILNMFGIVWLSFVSMFLSLFVFVLFIWDYVTIKKTATPPKWYTIIVYPWYVWKKNKLNADKTTPSDSLLFKLYICAFVLWIVASFIGISAGHTTDLAEAAKKPVTDIIHRYNSDVDCAKVSSLSKIAQNLYKAEALLTNGKTVGITIQERSNGTIFVTVVE